MLKYSALASLAIFVAVGCSKPSPVVGQWTRDYRAPGGKAVQTLDIRADGTLTDTNSVGFREGTLITIHEGKWKMSGDKFTKTISKIDLQIEGFSEKKKKSIEMMQKQNMPNLMTLVNKEPDFVIAFRGSDGMTLTSSGKAEERKFKLKSR